MPTQHLSQLMPSCGIMTADPVSYRAATSPHHTACIAIATGETVSYATLDQLIGNCALWLRNTLGQAKSARVAMLARNSIEQIMLGFACQRVGAIFVPLNWRLATTELAGLLEDCTPSLFICEAEFEQTARTAAGALPLQFILSDELKSKIAHSRATDVLASTSVDADAPCMLLYTSGTTGLPKGAIVTCRNAFYSALNFAFVGEIGPGTVALSDLPQFHTIGIIAVARTTLMMGGTLVISDRFVPARTLSCLSDSKLGVTHYFGVPQIASALINDPTIAMADLTRLHAIFVGGAPLSQALIEAYLAKGLALVNGYGMSEAGTVMHVPIGKQFVRDNPGSIGLPAPLMELRLVGADGTIVKDGEVGEIQLRGPSVTTGYWNKPEETAAAFVDGWYRTGDLAKRQANGFYRLTDRLKDMYISGGENVYPAEVEAVIAAHPDVLDVAVIGTADALWGECGVAFVVARKDRPILPAQIAVYCETKLARFKQPSHIFLIDAIPRGASGKILKQILRQRSELVSLSPTTKTPSPVKRS